MLQTEESPVTNQQSFAVAKKIKFTVGGGQREAISGVPRSWSHRSSSDDGPWIRPYMYSVQRKRSQLRASAGAVLDSHHICTPYVPLHATCRTIDARDTETRLESFRVVTTVSQRMR